MRSHLIYAHVFALPFCVSASPEIFHSEMVRLFDEMTGVVIYKDDILINGKTVDEHNWILERVLQEDITN